MAATVEKLLVRIDATTEQLRREMEKAERSVGTFRRNVDRHLTLVDRGFAKLNNAAKGMLGTLGAFAAYRLSGNLVDTLRQTEVQMSQLRTATGSLDIAKAKFEELADFAARTPYAIEQSIDAFVKLKNLGLDPSIDALTSYGNTAAAMGKNLNQMIEAVADAATGEFERLKEFGIKARSQGDMVSFTFQGVTTTVKKNAAEIESYLRSIGDVNFGGAMEDRAKTLDGALSNLGDSFTRLAITIGDLGLTQLISGIANAISTAAGDIANFVRTVEGFVGMLNGPISKLNELYEEQRRLQEIIENGRARRGGYRGTGVSEARAQLAEVQELITYYEQLLENTEVTTIAITGGMEAAAEATGQTADETKKFVAELNKLQAKYDQSFATLRKYEATQSDLLKLYQAGRISLDEYTAALEAHLNAADGVADIEVKFEQAAQNVDAFATVIDEGLRRVDGMFADMWRSIIDGTGNAFDSLKSMFRNLLAELAHAALTRPIMLTLGMGASGGVSASGLASNAGSLIGSAGSWLGSAGSSILSGAALSGMGTGFGMATANMGAAGYFGAMGSNLALAGSSLSSGAIGTALGAAAPYALPVIAGVALLSKLFKGKPSDKRQYADVDFLSGTVGNLHGFTGKKFSQENQDAAVLIGEMLAALGMSASSVTGTSLGGVRVGVGGRTGYRVGTIGADDATTWFSESNSSDAAIRAGIQWIMDQVSDELTDGVRALAQALDGSVEEVYAATQALITLQGQLDADVYEAYQRATAEANRSLTEVWRDQSGVVRGLAAELDGTSDSLLALGEANAARMQLELQLLGALDAAMAQVGDTLGGTIERITLDLLDQEGQYERIRGQAESLAASLNDMVDPAAISAAVQEIDRLTNAAYGLLDEGQRQSMGGEFLSFLGDVQALAEQRLDAARQDVVAESTAMRDVIESALSAAAAQFASAASTMQSAASTMAAAASSIPSTIRVQIIDQPEVNG